MTTPHTHADIITPKVGGRYNWRNQPERLVYLGMCEPRNGRWHQFAKVESPDVVWCEVTTDDLEHFEETEDADRVEAMAKIRGDV